jgi:AraC family transcriptional regulator
MKQLAVQTSIFEEYTSDGLGWQGISLYTARNVPPQEAAESLKRHLLVLHQTPQPVTTNEISEGFKSEKVARPGDLNLISAGAESFCRWDAPLTFVRLDIEPDFLQRVAIESNLTNLARLELTSKFRQQDNRLFQIGQWLQEEVQNGNPGGKLYADSLANVLAVHLLRNYAVFPATTPERSVNKSQIATVISYMRENLDREIGLDELALVSHISPSYLVRLFKQATGVAPHQYLIQLRVNRAKELLVQGKLSISEVALQTGFTDQSHLHRHFKRLTGLTPKALKNTQ